MVEVATSLGIGVVTSILTTLPKEVSKHYINRFLNRNERLNALQRTLDTKIEELKETLRGIHDAGPAGHSYLHSNWVESLEQLRYDLEDIQDSTEDTRFAAQSLQASIRHLETMQRALNDGVGGYRVTVGESSAVASLYELSPCDSLRSEAKREIIEELTSTTSSLGVCIIGICGLGKTALAKAVANEARIKAHFPCIITPPAYAPNFSLCSILEHIRAAYDPSFSLRSMWGYIKGTKPSKHKRVLVLLDGIPAPYPAQWALFRSLLRQSGPGSKFLITTRNPRAADVTGTSKHFLEPLTEEECLSLIQNHAGGNAALPDDDGCVLHHNRTELARKCRGLPLLANYIGLRLSAAQSGSRGTTIQHLTIAPEAPAPGAGLEWVLANLNPLLVKLPHLKRCVSYFSLFPPDYKFKEDSLVQLWMAEGFTQLWRRETHAISLQAAAYQNFEELHSYSLFRASKGGEEPSYEMHEAAYDLAQHISSRVCCRTLVGTSSLISTPSSISSKVRHFSLSCEYDRDVRNNDVQDLLCRIKYECRGLRTFLLLHDAGKKISNNPTFFQNLTHLRVLDLSHTCLTDLKNISKLICLRYLDLSHTPIETLPTLSSNLVLQVLKLNGCDNLFHLPQSLSKLTNLIALQVNKNECSGSILLPSIRKLSNLQKLDKFTVGTEQGYKIEELEKLNGLRGSLHIAQLENVAHKAEAQRSDLHKKGLLNTLELEWTNLSGQRRRRRQMGSTPEENAEQVFQGLEPPKNVKELILRNYYGSKYPEWLNSTQVCGVLKSIHLDCCKVLPSLHRLECLKTLRIEAMDKIPHLEHSWCQRFPCIELLVLCDMPDLNGWIELAANSMPKLCDLRVDKCRNLTQLPPLDRLTSLMKLQISRCPQLKKLPSMLPPSLSSITVKNSGISQQEAHGPRSRGTPVEIDPAATRNTVGDGNQSRSIQQGCLPRNLWHYLTYVGSRSSRF